MRIGCLFIALACCSPSPQKQLAPVQPKTAEMERVFTPDAANVMAAPRGARCSAAPCAEGLACAPLPGGYCASACGVTGAACDGACVETGSLGEVCAKRCRRDDECRVDEGYVCDRATQACLVPNVAAVVPATCPANGPARDAAFGDSSPWSTAASPGVYQIDPSAIVADDGGVVATYSARGAIGAPGAVGLSRVDGTGQRTTDLPVAREQTGDDAPSLARDRKGTLYATWLRGDSVVLATSADHGATWSTPATVHEPGDCREGDRDCFDRPLVAVGLDARTKRETVFVLYASAIGGLRVRASTDGGATFGPAVSALAGGHGSAVASSDGRLHAVAIDGGPLGGYGSAHQKIDYAVSNDGGARFGTPVTVSGPDEILPFYFGKPALAVDVRRRLIYVAYVRGGRDARWELVLAVSKDGGASWKRTRMPGADCAIHMVPALAVDPTTGTLHVAYYDNAGGGRFARASCGAGVTKCKLHGAVSGAPFATLSTVRHSSKWIGERAALLVDDKRRILHALWAQPVDESGKPVARIFHAAAKLPKR